MRTGKTSNLLGCVALLAGCAAIPEESVEQQRTAAETASRQASATAAQALTVPAPVDVSAVKLPAWDQKVLRVPGTANGYAALTDGERASRFGISALPASENLGGPKSPLGARAEKRLYRSDSWSLMMRDVDAYTMYMRRDLAPIPDQVAGQSIPDEKGAVSAAEGLLSKLGLPSDEAVLVGARGLAAAGTSRLGKTAPTVVGRSVEYSRTVGGLRVIDSRARFEFAGNGELRTAMISWPAFKLRPGLTKTRTAAAVAAEVAAWAAGRKILTTELVYRQADDGYMAPAVMVLTPPAGREFFNVVE